MTWSPDKIRRGMGVVFLGTAIVMLLLGQTVLKGRLRDMDYIFYWLVCFGFTVLAAMTALFDLRSMRSRIRAEQRDLIEDAVRRDGSGPGQGSRGLE